MPIFTMKAAYMADHLCTPKPEQRTNSNVIPSTARSEIAAMVLRSAVIRFPFSGRTWVAALRLVSADNVGLYKGPSLCSAGSPTWYVAPFPGTLYMRENVWQIFFIHQHTCCFRIESQRHVGNASLERPQDCCSDHGYHSSPDNRQLPQPLTCIHIALARHLFFWAPETATCHCFEPLEIVPTPHQSLSNKTGADLG
jgi:hypothetical protein